MMIRAPYLSARLLRLDKLLSSGTLLLQIPLKISFLGTSQAIRHEKPGTAVQDQSFLGPGFCFHRPPDLSRASSRLRFVLGSLERKGGYTGDLVHYYWQHPAFMPYMCVLHGLFLCTSFSDSSPQNLPPSGLIIVTSGDVSQ